MFNGVGVPTARGTGTSGYVQANKAQMKPHRPKPQPAPKREEAANTVDQTLAEHEIERRIENELMEFEEGEARYLEEPELREAVGRMRLALERRYYNLRRKPT